VVRPAVQPVANAMRQGIIHRGMAEGAGNADRFQRAVLIEVAFDAHNRVLLQEGHGDRDIVQVNLAPFEPVDDLLRERIDVHLQTHSQGLLGGEPSADPAKAFALDGLMQLQRIAPEFLIAKGIETENIPALGDHLCGILDNEVSIQGDSQLLCLIRGEIRLTRENRQTKQKSCNGDTYRRHFSCDFVDSVHNPLLVR